TRFSRDWSSDVCSSDLARLAQITQPVSLIVIDDGTKGSAMGAGTFKYSPREMSEKVVGMLTSSKHAKVLPEDFTLADLYSDASEIGRASCRETVGSSLG